MWNEKFELPDESYPVSDIQYYFEYIIKKYGKVTDNPLIRIYVNKIENGITFKIITGYYFKLLMPETMKLLGSTKSKIIQDANGENVPYLQTIEVVLVHCNIVSNDCQNDSKVLYRSVSNRSFGQILDISPKYFIFLKTFNSEFAYTELWFIDQNFRLLEIKDKINITLVIN